MGTSYTIKYVPVETDLTIAGGVMGALERFEHLFSTYDPKSEITRFNEHVSTEPFEASPEFAALVRRALALAERTGGAFDPTLGTLLRLYGFGPGGETPNAEPSPDDLAIAQASTGWTRLLVSEHGNLTKVVPALELDLNAFAKGAGVDVVAKVLDDIGITSYMVEIGGEVRCKGHKPDGAVWRLGVAHPRGVPADLADEVDLLDRANHYPSQLSGGQEQRVGIARAIVTDPTVVVADEPTGDLDPDTSQQILDLLLRLNKELGTTLLMVTHDLEAASIADRELRMDHGQLVDAGAATTIGPEAG